VEDSDGSQRSFKMLDIDGFLTSTQFVTQFASFITAIITAFLGSFLSELLGATGGTTL
jgi:hypothetical protein